MTRVRVGAVGAGWWATGNHFPILAARDDVELVGVCGLDPHLDDVREQFGFGFATRDYGELLAAELDAMIISTPHDLHYQQAKAAVECGLHVLVEKPVTLRADEAWDLARRVRDAGVHLVAPYGWNYKSFTGEARRLVESGGLGDIQHVLCHMASPTRGLFAGDPEDIRRLWDSRTNGPQASTWQSPQRGGGYAHGQVTHSTALLFWLTGLRTASVQARLCTGGAAVDLFNAAVVTFEGGAIGSLSGAATVPDGDPYQVDIRVFGTEGMLLVDTERERVALRRHDGARVDVPVEPGSGAYECLVPPNRLIDLVTGASAENHSTADIAARSVELIEAMHVSAATDGTAVRIPDRKETI